ncbi:phage baseplate assembly protein V [Pseudactinotalea suaedae]|uniref:phage baseplate assembly protein V n=1 Tax=Pseudactinotalea suaedae TaxID=1524924 RepID=UPI0012E1D506|nr:phage baseplate assembly protein V [Pseudactinotalea suaedae]
MSVTGQPRVHPHTQTQLAITLDGQSLSLDHARDLVEVRVELGVRAVGRAQLTFLDRDGQTGPSLLEVGTSVTIASVLPKKVLLTGTITALDMEADLSGTTVTATVQDHAHKLTRSRGADTFSEQSYRDVISKIATSAGMKAKLPNGGLSERFDWLLQVDSHLGLVDEIAGRFGLDWAVDDNTLALWSVTETAPHATSRQMRLGAELMTFSARRAELGPTSFTVRGWDSSIRRARTATVESTSARDGFAPRGASRASAPAKVLATHEVTSSNDEVRAVAAGLAAAAGRISGRGRSAFDPELVPGSEIRIGGTGSADGTYYVREVSHQVDAGSLRTSFVVGDRAPIQLSDPWGGPPRSSSMRRSGLTIGVVDNVKDPDKLGRVRVALPGISETTSSAWARVLSLGGGANHGLVVLPEVNDEVLVAFEDDDVRRPVVLGGLFSKTVQVAGPPAIDGDRVVSRHLVSGRGHRLELADGEGRNGEFVQMALADNQKRMRIGKDSSEIAAGDKPLTISSGGASIEFNGSGGITIDASTVTIKAKQSVRLEGVEVTGKASGKFEASGAQATISGSGPVTVKGAIVEISGSLVKIN